MKLPIRNLAARTAAISLLAAGSALALAPSAGAATTETNPVDDAVGQVVQIVYPDAVPEDFTAQERIEGLLGFNNYPGGPLGSWGPGGGAGLYGQIESVTGPLPLPSDSSEDDPFGDGSGNYTDPESASPQTYSPTQPSQPSQPPGPGH